MAVCYNNKPVYLNLIQSLFMYFHLLHIDTFVEEECIDLYR
jgi:hypothetical protein